MYGNWQIQQSRIAVKIILFLTLLPLILAFLLNITLFAKTGVLLLSPVFLYVLYNNIVLPGSGNDYRLSWSEGIWTFSGKPHYMKSFIIQGVKNKKSYSLGFMMLLSITDKDNQSVDLILFPDSINVQKKSRQKNSPQGDSWRKLHCCFFLADEQAGKFFRKV